ncbi:MAG: hotdog fold thioesterase [Pseudomonadota bacterium]|nr:hotdog fold thioesterase [Pseudomonadota bacterium]
MPGHLGVEFLEAGDNWLTARMPVDDRTRQPAGILHGGASLVLAETLASTAAFFSIDANSKMCVGLEINANHVRSVREGYVYGRATPLHRGRSTQVWEIRVTDEQDRLVCMSRCTIAILDAC